MASFNSVHLLGNLTRDPELRVTPKGTPICQFGLAINRQYKDDAGAMRDETTFLDIEAWGKQGELAAKYLQKGQAVMIDGRLKQEQWEDKTTGQKRSRIKVVADRFVFLPRSGSQVAQNEDFPSDDRRPAATAQAQSAVDEDVPF